MPTYVLPILKPLSSVTTTVVTTTTTYTLGTTLSGINGPPPTRILGYFAGCPNPGMPVMPLAAQAISNIVQRCNIAPPWVRVIPRWNVMPARFVGAGRRAF